MSTTPKSIHRFSGGGEKEGGGHPYGGYSSPIVADGRVYVNQWAPSGDIVADESQKTTDRRIDADDVVFCFDAATGQPLRAEST